MDSSTSTAVKKGFLSRFIGDKAFYKMVFAVAIPIMIQNGITNFVSLLDNIMVGQVGQEQMSGVSIVNQLLFIFNLGIFGAMSGAGHIYGAVPWQRGYRRHSANVPFQVDDGGAYFGSGGRRLGVVSQTADKPVPKRRLLHG